MTQIQLSFDLIRDLYSKGVRDFVLCAGGRNSPLVEVLIEIVGHQKNKNIQVHHFFNENSGAFFALGKIKSENRPVVVITTSGTAVAETLPAVIEAHYTCLPLIVVSADRPAAYRGSGAPQVIEQVGLFSNYVQECFELNTQSLDNLTVKGFELGCQPWHINVEFDEPLIDASVKELDIDSLFLQDSFGHNQSAFLAKDSEKECLQALRRFFTENSRTLILIGELSVEEKSWVCQFLRSSSYPVFVESLSGLSSQEISPSLYLSSDRFVQKKLLEGEFDSILRFGGVPVSRTWRDLEGKLSHLSVLSISERPFSGLSEKRSLLPAGDWLGVFTGQASVSQKHLNLEKLKEQSESLAVKTRSLFEEFPSSEIAIFYKLAQQIPPSDRIYLGNSMPVRQWDLVSHLIDGEEAFEVAANRGANGIDGQVSTFFGWSLEERIQWGILGDLTTLYDQSGLWASRYAKGKWRLVVVNNGGGRIFSRIFSNPSFLNEHDIEFSKWAEMWGCSYLSWNDTPSNLSDLPDRVIIELKPDLKQSEDFWQSYQNLF